MLKIIRREIYAADYKEKNIYAADYEGNCQVQCISAQATPAMPSIILQFVCITLSYNQDDSDERNMCFLPQ